MSFWIDVNRLAVLPKLLKATEYSSGSPELGAQNCAHARPRGIWSQTAQVPILVLRSLSLDKCCASLFYAPLS